METSNEKFKQQLDRMIIIFRKIREKKVFSSMEPSFYQSLDMVIANYEMIKNHLSNPVLDMVGQPIKQMMLQVIQQLSKEMNLSDIDLELPPSNEKEQEKMEIFRDIQQIDKQLSNQNLSEAEINALLDERRNFKKGE